MNHVISRGVQPKRIHGAGSFSFVYQFPPRGLQYRWWVDGKYARPLTSKQDLRDNP